MHRLTWTTHLPRTRALLPRSWWWSLLFGVLPIVGEATDAGGLLTGYSITGRELSANERMLCGLGMLVPFVPGRALSSGGEVLKRTALVTGRSLEEVRVLQRVATHLLPADAAGWRSWYATRHAVGSSATRTCSSCSAWPPGWSSPCSRPPTPCGAEAGFPWWALGWARPASAWSLAAPSTWPPPGWTTSSATRTDTPASATPSTRTGARSTSSSSRTRRRVPASSSKSSRPASSRRTPR